jgi:hypothetical protein
VRAAGLSLTTDLLEEWSPSNDSDGSFAKDPPNATVSTFGKDGSKIRDAVVVLKTAKLEGDRLTFDVDVLEGEAGRPRRPGGTLHRPLRLRRIPRRRLPRRPRPCGDCRRRPRRRCRRLASSCREFFYWTDDGNLAGLRYDQWKAAFLEQRAHGLDVWSEPLMQLRLPKLFNLRSDPFERAQYESGDCVRWFIEHAFVIVPAQAIVAQHLASFQQFPPRQRPGLFSVEQALEKLRNPPSSN